MITVVPETYTKVDYDAAVLAGYAQTSLERVMGLVSDLDVDIRIDEEAATTRFAIVSIDPIVVDVNSGAVENLRDPRRLGEGEANLTFTRIFLEVFDRRSATFGAPALDEKPLQQHLMAWDVNLHGRLARMGLRLHQPRYRYNFRNRHGFSDHADGIFDQLWDAGDTTWGRIVELSDSALTPVDRGPT